MRLKILVLGLALFFTFAYCTSPADPDIEEALNPEPIPDVSYSIKFDLMVLHDMAATGDFYLSLLEETPSDNVYLKSLEDLDFSPPPDNPNASEGTVSFWTTVPEVPSGTYNLVFRLAHYNDYELDQITPGEWVIKMIVSSSNLELMIGGGVQEQRFALWKVGQDNWFTFSISD